MPLMSRDRYLSIVKFLRFSLVKEVKKVKHANNSSNLDEKWRCGENISMDDALLLWKELLYFCQFIDKICTIWDQIICHV